MLIAEPQSWIGVLRCQIRIHVNESDRDLSSTPVAL